MSLAFETRRRIILNRLFTEHKLYVQDLANSFNVSTETIRRDLDRLEKEGKLKKVYGGAVLENADDGVRQPPFYKKTVVNQLEKLAVAKLAASLVEDDDIIAIGNGSTVLEIVRFIDKKNVTLVTGSIPVLNLALEEFSGDVIFIGGKVSKNQQFTYGPLVEQDLKKLKFDKAFISAFFSLEDGLSDYSINEAHVSTLLAERAKELIVLADYSKFDETNFAYICDIDEVTSVVTDWNCSEHWKNYFAKRNISLLLAEKPI